MGRLVNLRSAADPAVVQRWRQNQTTATGKVTAGLALHCTCITDSVAYTGLHFRGINLTPLFLTFLSFLTTKHVHLWGWEHLTLAVHLLWGSMYGNRVVSSEISRKFIPIFPEISWRIFLPMSISYCQVQWCCKISMFLTNDSPDLYAVTLRIMFTKNNFFLSWFLGYQRIWMKMLTL